MRFFSFYASNSSSHSSFTWIGFHLSRRFSGCVYFCSCLRLLSFFSFYAGNSSSHSGFARIGFHFSLSLSRSVYFCSCLRLLSFLSFYPSNSSSDSRFTRIGFHLSWSFSGCVYFCSCLCLLRFFSFYASNSSSHSSFARITFCIGGGMGILWYLLCQFSSLFCSGFFFTFFACSNSRCVVRLFSCFNSNNFANAMFFFYTRKCRLHFILLMIIKLNCSTLMSCLTFKLFSFHTDFFRFKACLSFSRSLSFRINFSYFCFFLAVILH